MYDRPETAATLDALWREIRSRLPEGAPETLTRGGSLWDVWEAPDLVLSQTCGYPYRARLKGHVQLVAMPDNRLPGVPPGHYNSVFVVRADDPRRTLTEFADALLAFNEPLSQSGWGAPQNHAAARGFKFSRDLYTGAHVRSARALAEGRAEIACIDALSWRLIQRHDPHAAGLREIERTAPTPAPPFITSMDQDAAAIRAALAEGIAALSPEQRDVIGLFGICDVPEADYLAVPNPAPPTDPESRV
ncbi:phosphate/phosphite/phosphonate ABC transporter substrate-binding protein [Roseovarius aquimarinus]